MMNPCPVGQKYLCVTEIMRLNTVKLGHNELAWAGRAVVFRVLNGPGGRPKRLAYVIWPCLRALHQSGGLVSMHDQPRRVRYDRVFTVSLYR